MIYFIKGLHMREFGFPRVKSDKKVKWKKINFTTDLPKNDPICTYLVANGTGESSQYRMHVVVNSNEYNKLYRNSETLKELKRHSAKGLAVDTDDHIKKKLLPEDREANSERIMLCHIRTVVCKKKPNEVFPAKKQKRQTKSTLKHKRRN